MGNYWKRRFYQKRAELHKQRKRMKVLLGCMIALTVIFGTLFIIGYTGKQAVSKASETMDTFSVSLINAINAYEGIIITIVIVVIIIMFIVLMILSWIPRTTTSSYGGGY